MYKIEKDTSFYISLKVLLFFFQIPENNEKSFSRSFLISYIFARIFCFIVCCVLPVLHLIMSVRANLEVDIIEDFCFPISVGSALSTNILFTFLYKKWLAFFSDVTDYRNFGEPATSKMLVKSLNRLSFIYAAYYTSGCVIFGISRYIESAGCRGLSSDKGFFCGSYLPIWVPFDISDIKIKVVVFIAQFVCIWLTMGTAPTGVFIAWEATEMLISHINSLKTHFLEISYESQARSDELRFCINYHNHILRLANDLQVLVKRTHGHVTMIPAIIFALIGGQMSSTKVVGSLIYLVGYIGAFFLLCHAGQRIEDETLDLGFAVYDSKWYQADAETMKDVMFVIARCQIPFQYDALPLGVIGYPLFLMIIKTSYSYLTLLSQAT